MSEKKKDNVDEKAKKVVKDVEEMTDKKIGKLEEKMDKILEVHSKEKEEEGGKGKLYSEKFTKSDVEKMGWKEKGFHYLRSVVTNNKGGLEALSEGTDADGGYLVPEEYRAEVMKRSRDAAVIRPRATVIPMNTDTLNLTNEDTKPKVYSTAEGAAKTTTSSTFGTTQLTLHKVAATMALTDELKDDANIGVIEYLTTQLAEAVAAWEDDKFLTGGGTTEPTGIDNYTLTTVDAGGDLSYTHLVDAKYELPQGYRNNAVWIMNSKAIAEINKLQDDNSRPLLVSVQGGTKETLLGYPVLENNNCADSKIFFGDLSRYIIGDKGDMKVDTSIHGTIGSTKLFEEDKTGLRVVKRMDGQLPLTEAFVELSNVQA